MSVHMAPLGYELLAALDALLNAFDDGDGGNGLHMATITPGYRAALQALVARAGLEQAFTPIEGATNHG